MSQFHHDPRFDRFSGQSSNKPVEPGTGQGADWTDPHPLSDRSLYPYSNEVCSPCDGLRGALPESVGYEIARPFSHSEADRLVTRALMNAAFLQRTRDYRLLEIAVPILTGAFESARMVSQGEVLTLTGSKGDDINGSLASIGVPALQLAKRINVQDACMYLTGSAMKHELHAMLIAERLANSSILGRVLSVPIDAISFLFNGGGFGVWGQIRQIYRMGLENLTEDPKVCAEMRSFLGATEGLDPLF